MEGERVLETEIRYWFRKKTGEKGDTETHTTINGKKRKKKSILTVYI